MEIIPDEMDFSLYLHETDIQAHVKEAKTYAQALKDRLRYKKVGQTIYLPWTKTNDNFDFRKGEVTVWAGQNGHGKSLVTSQIALSLMGQDQKVSIASFEMKPLATMQRMARMYCGMNPFSPEFQGEEGMKALDILYDEFCGWTEGRMWLYDQNGTTDTEKVIGMVRYCAKVLKIDHIFIDNLAKCIKNEDDYNSQKGFVDEMTAIARDYQCHIHIVHHLKKPAKETDRPDKNDVKGSGSITDQIDNLFLVWRNKDKEEDIKTGSRKLASDPDTILFCRKNRNHEGIGEGEPTIMLWYHQDSGQFLERPDMPPQCFYNYPHVASE